MLGIITLLVAVIVQIGFLSYRLVTKNRQTKVKHLFRIAAFIAFSLLLLTNVYWFGFRWIGLFALLAILALFSVVGLIRKPRAENQNRRLSSVLSCIGGCILITLFILPGIIFPQFDPIATTGSYNVETSSITFIDSSRIDPYSKTGDNRKLSIQFWSPAVEGNSKPFPLVIFSHGSFGYRGSNLSTFENLAANGYVVCSIDHSYHSFFAQHTDGATTFVNTEFLNDAVSITNDAYDRQSTYYKTHEWLDLRVVDIDFILGEIFSKENKEIPESIYSLIDSEKIGLFGHSLGGAAAAQLGREHPAVDTVIVIDGTMIGEEIGFKNDQPIFSPDPYPVPLLNLYNDSHYTDAIALGTAYNNVFASSHAIEAIYGTGS